MQSFLHSPWNWVYIILVFFQARLEEYKIGHKQEEEGMEDDITSLEDKLLDVKSTLESR